MGTWKWVWYMGRDPKPDKLAEILEQCGEDWRDHPTLTAYRFDFTQEELDNHWAWMVQRRDLYLDIFETGKLLPVASALASGSEWECGFCSYKEECEWAQSQ